MKPFQLFPELVTGLLLSAAATAFAPSAQGQIFVSYNNGTIRKFDSGGSYTNFATGLSTPKGLAIRAGFLYVANSSASPNHTILKFPTSGGSSAVFANSGLDGDYGEGPYGLAFDSAGDLYVANHSANTLLKLNSAGLPVSPFPVTSGSMSGPDGLAVDASNNVYVSSMNNNTIQKFNNAGTSASDFVSSGLNGPRGLAIRDGILYVANYGDSTIKMFAVTNGAALGDYATSADGIGLPVGIAFDGAGCLYVANADWNIGQRILKFTAPHVGTVFSAIYNESPDFIVIESGPTILNIALYVGLTLQGTVGDQIRIDYAPSLNPPPVNWTERTTLTLPSSPFLYVDTNAPASNNGFYRAVAVP